MGSGHVLVYAFDVFMNLYRAEGYTDREAAELIIKHNLFGLEIDKRAYQLAYFAIMMKGRQHNRRLLTKNIELNLHYFISIDELLDEYLERLQELSTLSTEETIEKIQLLKEVTAYFKRGAEIGSILKLNEIEQVDINGLLAFIEGFNDFTGMDILYGLPEIQASVKQVLKIANLLLQKYTAVVTNPPYLNKMSDVLGKYVTDNYKDVKTDLFSVFIKMNSEKLISGGYAGFMTPFVWMFIKSYEELRSFLIRNKSISSLIQMEYSAFEEATVPICCFMIKNSKTEQVGNYFKLSDFRGGMKVQSEKVLEGVQNPNVDYFYQTNQENFTKIPGSPISFWVSENVFSIFSARKNYDLSIMTKKGILTGNDALFKRFWFEVSDKDTYFSARDASEIQGSGRKWFPSTGGGVFKRWYGNLEDVVLLENNGQRIKEISKNYRLREPELYFKEAFTWTEVTSGIPSIRYVPKGILFGNGGPVAFNEKNLFHNIAFFNSIVSMYLLKIIAPTLNLGPEQVKKIPSALYSDKNESLVIEITNQQIGISKKDWDSCETSWDFKKHFLV